MGRSPLVYNLLWNLNYVDHAGCNKYTFLFDKDGEHIVLPDTASYYRLNTHRACRDNLFFIRSLRVTVMLSRAVQSTFRLKRLSEAYFFAFFFLPIYSFNDFFSSFQMLFVLQKSFIQRIDVREKKKYGNKTFARLVDLTPGNTMSLIIAFPALLSYGRGDAASITFRNQLFGGGRLTVLVSSTYPVLPCNPIPLTDPPATSLSPANNNRLSVIWFRRFWPGTKRFRAYRVYILCATVVKPLLGPMTAIYRPLPATSLE
ncbi:hypothetical protein QTP88_024284 [Uroleucon formosanum]